MTSAIRLQHIELSPSALVDHRVTTAIDSHPSVDLICLNEIIRIIDKILPFGFSCCINMSGSMSSNDANALNARHL